MKTTAMAILK